MQLTIRNLLPTYFPGSSVTASGIWGRELVFEKGEFVKIVAPSGKGKSSLVNFLYGLRTDYKGTISYDGQHLRDFSPEQLASIRKDHVSIVFQDLRLFGSQSARDNLEIKRQLNPFHPAEKITEMADRLGIEDRLPFSGSTCSYGEQQRIAIIRSLMQPFDILLLDEPFSHLDNNNAALAMELILEETRLREATIIFVDLERSDLFPATQSYHL